MGRIWPRPPSRATMRRRTRCQSYGRDESGQLTHTDPNRKTYPRQSRAPAEPGGHTVSYEVNTFLLQYALNRLNILLILAGNANVTLDLAVTVLENFELKRDSIQTENDVPAR